MGRGSPRGASQCLAAAIADPAEHDGIIENLARRLAATERRLEQLEAELEAEPSAVGDRAWVGPWRQLAKDDAAQYTKLAIDALSKAEEAIGGEAVQEARELLEGDPPSSNTAARALMLIGAHAAGGQDKDNTPTLNERRKHLRNAVAMQVRAEAEPMDENSYDEVLAWAFEGNLDR